METVIVTGGLGNVGQWFVEGLADDGYEVVALDLEHPGFFVERNLPNVSFRAVDLSDLGKVQDVFHSVDPDAVVHLAAINTMGRTADSEVFQTNITTTYNVLKTAGRCGADVVQASSESVYGMAFAEETFLPDYLPVDEEHPTRPEDEYGTSKLLAEDVARMVVRRHDIDAVSVRPAWVNFPGTYACTDLQDDLAPGSNAFWTYIDVRDLYALFQSAIETDVGGHEAVLAAAENNYVDQPTVSAIREHFGEVPDDCTLNGEESIYSTAKATRLFGWEPEHTWRTAADESVDAPSFTDD